MKTVEELINELSKYPKDSKVEIIVSYDDGFGCACAENLEVEYEYGKVYIAGNNT